MSVSGLIPLRFQKNWYRGEFVAEKNWDEIANKTQVYGLRTNNNLLQIGFDLGGPTYQFNNNGVKTQPISVFERLNSLENQVDFQAVGTQNIGLDFSTAGSVIITGANGISLSSSNKGIVTVVSALNNGQLITYEVTSDVTIALTGASWGRDTLGDYSDATLFLLALDTGSSLAWGIAARGGRTTVASGNCFTVASSVATVDDVLTNTTVGATNFITEIAYFRADFDDTGNPLGANAWIVDTNFPVVFGDSTKQRIYYDVENQLNINGTVTGTYTLNGTVTLPTIQTSLRITGAAGINPVLYWNADTGDDWYGAIDVSQNVFQFGCGSVVGTTPVLNLFYNSGAPWVFSQGDLAVNQDQKLILDGLAPASTANYLSYSSGSNLVALTQQGEEAFQFQANGAGLNNAFAIANSSNTAGSGTVLILETAGTSAGDPHIRFRIADGGATWITGVDNDASDWFKIQKASNLTTDHLIACDQGGSGADNWMEIQNLNNTAGSRAYLQLQVGGTSAGDPFIYYDIPSGTSWHTGPDNSFFDNFVFGTGSTVGSNNIMTLYSTGFMTVGDNQQLVSSDIGFAALTASSNACVVQAWSSGSGGSYIEALAGSGTGDAYFFAETDSSGGNPALLLKAGTTNYYVGIENASDYFILGEGTLIGGGGFLIYGASSNDLYMPTVYNAATGGTANLVVDSGGFLHRSSSSIRYKKDIVDLDDTSFVYDLRPVKFKSNQKTSKGPNLGMIDDDATYVGFIAEEVIETCPLLATINDQGQPESVNYDRVSVYLVAELKKLRDRVIALETA